MFPNSYFVSTYFGNTYFPGGTTGIYGVLVATQAADALVANGTAETNVYSGVLDATQGSDALVASGLVQALLVTGVLDAIQVSDGLAAVGLVIAASLLQHRKSLAAAVAQAEALSANVKVVGGLTAAVWVVEGGES